MAIIMTKAPISIEAMRPQLVVPPTCGAALWFDGIVRDHNAGQSVTGITYECYETMAHKQFEAIGAEARGRWNIVDLVVAHRLGYIPVGEASLVLGLCSPHRREAIDALDWYIDQLKVRVPIWKKEHYVDQQSEWLTG